MAVHVVWGDLQVFFFHNFVLLLHLTFY
jgi:hypothetical protein